MNTTINITIPKELKQEADSAIRAGMFSSFNELVRTSIRQVLPKKRSRKIQLTINGFTPEFEREVLAAEKEPIENDLVWDGKGSFSEFVLKHSKRIHRT